MSHTVDETGVVEGFLVQQAGEIGGYFLLILPVFHLFLHVVEHLYHFDIGAAVLGAF